MRIYFVVICSLFLFCNCSEKCKEVNDPVADRIKYFFNNLENLDTSKFHNFIELGNCKDDSVRLYKRITEIVPVFSPDFKKLDRKNIVVKYYDINCFESGSVQFKKVNLGDTLVYITDKNGFMIEGKTPFVIHVKNGKIASFGMFGKDPSFVELLDFCPEK